MSRKILKTEKPVVLEGYQSVLQVSQFGNHQLEAILGDDLVDILEADRPAALEWARSKAKNPGKVRLNDEPWKHVAEGKYKARFTWTPDKMPVVVDTEGTPVTDTNINVMSGSKVKLAFYQKPYSLPSGTIGTKLVLEAVQIVSLADKAGIDIGDDGSIDVKSLFGTTVGYKQSAPNIIAKPDEPEPEDEDDF